MLLFFFLLLVCVVVMIKGHRQKIYMQVVLHHWSKENVCLEMLEEMRHTRPCFLCCGEACLCISKYLECF